MEKIQVTCEMEVTLKMIGGESASVFVNKKVLQKGSKKVSTFNTQ